MKSYPQLLTVAAILWWICLGLFVGCGKSTVEAVPRVSNSKPVFGNESVVQAEKKSGDINFDFVHADHFACLSLNVERILSHSELKDVSWSFLESKLAQLVGHSNANLKSVDRVWLLLDRESVALAMEGNTDGLLVTVIQYKSAPDLSQLALANSVRANQAEIESKNSDSAERPSQELQQSEKNMDMVAISLGGNRIAIGGSQLVSKMKGPQQTSELVRQLRLIDFSADVEGIVTAGPVRETLRSVFGLAAQFGGEEARKFASLPEVLEQVEVKMSIDGDPSGDLLNFKVKIDDQKMVEQIVRTTQQAISQSTPEAGGNGAAMGIMFGGGFQRKDNAPESVYPLETTEAAQKVSREIQEKDLFSVEGGKGFVEFRLSQPAQTSQLVRAIVADSKRAAEFESRLAKLGKIAAAMKRYHQEHGCFPPPGPVMPDDSSEPKSLPPQLNWRVGLLPFLDQQSLYDQFDFKSKWDSEINRRVSDSIPEVFSITNERSQPLTRFHLPGGELGLFAATDEELSSGSTKKLADISDRKTWTAIVVESDSDDQVIWTKPAVLKIGKGSVSQPGRPLGRADERGVLIVNGAFKTRVVRNFPDTLKSVLTPAGGEKLTTRDFYPISEISGR